MMRTKAKVRKKATENVKKIMKWNNPPIKTRTL